MQSVAGIPLPESALCEAATELARSVSAPFLFNHVMRAALYAEWLGQRREQAYDRETLFLATVLHDLGLTALASVRERFEVEGADAAKEFLARQGVREATIERVWDAIALHTTAGIPLRKSAEVALCHLGVACDIRGLPERPDFDAVRRRALDAYPWLDLHTALPEALVALYRKSPSAAASHAVADACERAVPGFARFNLCDVLLAMSQRGAP